MIVPEPSAMPRKGIRRGILGGLILAVFAGAVAESGRIWLRVLIAPAWRTGALASGSTANPSLGIVVLVAFVIGFAVGFVSAAPESLRRSEGGDARLLAAHLVALCVVVGLELFFYSGIASWLLESVGAGRSLGGEFPLVLATRILPGALAFLVVAFIAVFASRRDPVALRTVLAGAWVCQFLLLAGSVSWYVSPAGPAQ
jgi:hypothetical protein